MSTKTIPAKTRTLCNRCGVVIPGGMGMQLKGTRGHTVANDTGGGPCSLDLCEACAAGFDKWMKAEGEGG